MKHLYQFCLIVLLFTACTSGEVKVIDTGKASNWNTSGNVSLGSEAITLTGTDAVASTKKTYKNFELDFELKTAPGAIGGIWFHTNGVKTDAPGYEIFINNNKEANEWRKTGGLTAVRNFGKRTAPNDTWVPVKVEVTGKQVKVFVNNIFVTDYTEPEQPYREAQYDKRLIAKGVFMFTNQGNASISIRNINVKALPDDLVNNSEAIDEQTDEIIRLQQKNFPTIDYHLHLKGGWTKEQAAARSRKLGITYGIAPNCGKNFPVTSDADIATWLDTMKHLPFLMPMQAEGREWRDMFSPEAIEKFDYRFTDAMTWTDDKGRRMRIWITRETFIDNEQRFMDMLVERACGIITTEPIHIYVNPTFIPFKLMPKYDELWTTERMQKVIDACVSAGVAIEINNFYRIPSIKFIKMAKASGAKFTFGTNNTSPDDVGKLEYAIEVIKSCGLTINDMCILESKNL